MEKKYKGMIKQMKNNEKNIIKENKDLKKLINNQENNNKALLNDGLNNDNNQMNRTMFSLPIQNNILNDNSNSMMMQRIEDPNEGNQKKALEEFKDLLKKIDEKLETNSYFEKNI